MPSIKRLVLLVAVAIMAAACWHHSVPPAPGEGPAMLHVENHNWQEVDIQVVHRGIRVRLGSVAGASTRELVFPRSVMGDLGEVQLVAHAIGTPETITTAVIVLKPGTQVRWTLETSLSRSSLSVY